MRNRGLLGIVLAAIAIVRLAFALSYMHSVQHSAATAASPPSDRTTAMADARQPDDIRSSHDSEVTLSDGRTRQPGDSSGDQAMRRAIAARSQAELDEDDPEPEPTPTPGEPMMEPTPSR